ncbi:hypothetical protein Sya03_38980 [Spirilliplanes yamanashiensis]|uniref:Sensor-like histidine kinase SenX3 n=1 Tax=Spirilliplanes yamanashiensis TaxID=42233 RepID=A0A8J3Y9M1_9ACTN|nr:hypothetical protein Sya03_38980 [Spirilliplanes yamanashiensis]
MLATGLGATWYGAAGLRADDATNARRVMDQRTAVARASVIAETGRYLDLLQTVAAGLGAGPDISASGFQAATAPLATSRLTGATGVALVVPADTAEVAAVEAAWRARGAAGLRLSPRPGTTRHLFPVLSRPLNATVPATPGADLAASVEASAALAEGRRTGAPAVSDAYVLLRDRALPPSRQQLSFVFAAPVYAPGDGGAFRGWVVLGLRGQDFLGGVLGDASQGLLAGTLRATDSAGRAVTVAAYQALGRRDLRRQATFPVGDQHWTLVTEADSARLPGARTLLPLTVEVGGAAATVLLAGLMYVLATGRARAQARVRTATAELRQAEAEARRQAGLLSAIMASLGDGVGVIDEQGRYLLHNPAARALLGTDADVDGPDNWQRHYGLFLPDGTTPFPEERMPLVRGLRGESSDGVEMIVRNAGRPEGILLSVDGRPLDASAGQRGAVAVFRDITALRRYENDLAVFAGVVAHDLKAPLSVVRAHCELAIDQLAEAPPSDDVTQAHTALRRILGAADRMAALIDTLLAYTTARDAPLSLTVVPLGPLVADVVRERTEHLRRGTDPSPAIYVGALPAVTGDPAMLRHVVDNLIGNALKYVRPGQDPRVDVTALPAEGDRVRFTVADRGIGIPDDDKPRIFETFHRAHAGKGYAGTGLGLAICRRIVERHGGTVTVEDNPGGGTRFVVSLPAAAADAAGDGEPAAAPLPLPAPEHARA